MKTYTPCFLAAGLLLVVISGTSSAATVTLNSTPYTASTDVSTNGGLVVAAAAGDAADVTDNGVTFTADLTGTVAGGGATVQYFGNPTISSSTDDPANPDLFDNHIFTNGGGDGSFNISGLIENTPYELQLFIGDTRSCCNARFVHIWDEATAAGVPDLTLAATNDNNVVTGTFTTGAGETTQSLFISIDSDADETNGIGFGGFDGHVNAFQLRNTAIPEPCSLALLGAAGLGLLTVRRSRR